jgi:hypothetical protein
MTSQLQKARLKFRFPPGDEGKPMRDAVTAAFYALRATIGTPEHPEVMGSPWDWRLTASATFKLESDKLREHVRFGFAPQQGTQDAKAQLQKLKDLFGGLQMLQEPTAGAPSQPSIDLKKNGPLVEIAA